MGRGLGIVAAVGMGLMVGSAFGVEVPVLTLDSGSGAAATEGAGSGLVRGMPRNTAYASKLTLYWENDGGWARPVGRTDRHYTAGVGASLAWQAPWVEELLSLAPTVDGEFSPEQTDYAMGFVGGLTIYTPVAYGQTVPLQDDRPFAGWTYGGLYAQRGNRFAKVPVWESLEMDLGLVGPSSLAENAQSMIHDYFHYRRPRGWNNQINDEAEFSIKYNRRWRVEVWKQEQLLPGFQVLPEAGLTAGTVLDEVHAGAVFRLGWNMPNDFGPGELKMPADFTEVVPCYCEDWLEDFFGKQSFTFFVRPYGSLVARNTLLQGDVWSNRDPVSVTPEPAVFAVEYGLTHRFMKHFELTYAWTSESPEFKGQHNWDTWATVQLSFYVAW